MTTQRPLASLRICIVGAGPAGLTAAEELKKKGYRNITILEAKKRAGGKAMSIPFHDNDGNQLGIYEGGNVFILPSKILQEYARRFGITTTFDVFPPARCIDLPTGSVCHPFLVPSTLPVSRRVGQIVRLLGMLRRFAHLDGPGFTGPMYGGLTEPCSVWLTREALGFAREALFPLVSALQFPTTDGQIPAAYFIKTAILIGRMNLYRQLRVHFPKFAEGNQVLWQRLAGEHTVLFRSPVRRISRGKTIRIETPEHAFEFDRMIWAAPTEDFLAVADTTPEERDVLSRVRVIKRAVITCRIDGLPPKVCYFVRNTVDHGVPMAYPYALMEVTPGTGVYNLYPYMTENTSVDELVRNVYDLARKLGGKRAKILSHPLLWKWFPYFSSEDFRSGVYDRFELLQGQRSTFFVGEILAGVSIPRAMEFSAALVERHFARPLPVALPELSSVPVLPAQPIPASLLTTMPPPPAGLDAGASGIQSMLAALNPGAGNNDQSYPRMAMPQFRLKDKDSQPSPSQPSPSQPPSSQPPGGRNPASNPGAGPGAAAPRSEEPTSAASPENPTEAKRESQ